MKTEYDTCSRCKGRKLGGSRLCVHCKPTGATSKAWKGGDEPCPDCGGPKFRTAKRCRNGFRKYPDEQHLTAAERMRAYRRTPQGARVVRRANLKSKFGITETDYDEMLEQQDGVCAACGKEETHRNQYGVCSLAVDHDHETGVVRGLLCGRCNRALGLFGASPERVGALLSYIERVKEVVPHDQGINA